MATFSDIFNSRLGNRIGVQSQEHDPRNTAIDPKAAAANSARRLAIAEVLAERAGKAQSNSGGSAPVGGFSPQSEKVLLESADWKPKQGFMGTLKGIGTDALDVGTRGLDIISRPAYGAFEAAKELSQTTNEGENILQSLDNVAGGALSGLAGKEKTGWGEVVEENAKRDGSAMSNPNWWLTGGPLNPMAATDVMTSVGEAISGKQLPLSFSPATTGQGTNELARNGHGQMAQNIKRGLGLYGELALDPLNAVAGSAKAVGNIDEVKLLAKTEARDLIHSHGLSAPFNKIRIAPTGEVDAAGRKLTANIPANMYKIDDIIEEAYNKTLLEINKGASGGRILGAEMAPGTVAARTTEGVRSVVFQELDASIAKFVEHLDGTKRMTVAEINALKKQPFFNDFSTEMLKAFNAKRTAAPFKSFDDMMLRTAGSGATTVKMSHLNRASEITKAKLDKTFEEINTQMVERLRGKLYNAPGIKVAGKDIVFDRVGKAYANLKNGKLQTPGIKGLSYSKQFPGRTSLITQRIRSAGNMAYEAFHNLTRDVAKGITKSQRRELSEHILRETIPADPKLANAMAYIKDQYAQMFKAEMDAGVRDASDTLVDNYVYMYYKGKAYSGSNVVDNHKKFIKSQTGKKLPANALELAKAKKLRPEEDAFKALLLRKMESNRKITRAAFKEDLIDHYGVLANRLTERSMHLRDLKNFNSKLPIATKATMKPGDQWYLPEDIHKIYENFDELLRSNLSEDTVGFIRTLDKLTRMFKASATIPYPGFHIRNALGDIYMSHLDGVDFQDYVTIRRLANAESNPNKVARKIKIGNQEFTLADIKKLFDENAASGGFQSSDLGADVLSAKLNPQRVPQAMRDASQHREDFFRFTHFFHAFKEELAASSRKFKDPAVARRHAIEASTYRVNKSLFDYGALTKLERNTIRRIIPFYTYSRKVVPALMEAMFLNPGQMSKTNRFFIENEDAPLQDMLIPGYQREIGYAKLTDEEEPWLLGAQFLPVDAMRKNMDFSSDEGIARNFMGQTNPFFKMIAEKAGGSKFFNQADVEPGAGYYTGALAPPVGPIQDLLGGWDPLGNVIGEGNKDGAERLTAGRLTLGMPITKLREDQQTSSLFNLENSIEEKMGQINKELEENGYRIYLSKRSNGTTFRIRNIESGKVVANAGTPEQIEQLSIRFRK